MSDREEILAALQRSEDRITSQLQAVETRIGNQVQATDARLSGQIETVDARVRDVEARCVKISTQQAALEGECLRRHDRGNIRANQAHDLAESAKTAADSNAMRIDTIESEEGPIKKLGDDVKLLQSRAAKVVAVLLAGGVGGGGTVAAILELLK